MFALEAATEECVGGEHIFLLFLTSCFIDISCNLNTIYNILLMDPLHVRIGSRRSMDEVEDFTVVDLSMSRDVEISNEVENCRFCWDQINSGGNLCYNIGKPL